MHEQITIEEGGLDDPQVVRLLQQHLELMQSQSPPESTHALNLEGLRTPDMTFWTARDNDQVIGCVALKQLDNVHGEIKSMHTAAAARGRGVARQMLTNLEKFAQENGLKRLSLETGTPDGFAAARFFYEIAGYETCDPFADYSEDPFSVFMTKELR